ncbi:hypothetical protein E8E11_009940 [Didymella keratinophila]|nr:hypothetical protein E8E11_009940 [Didymella keratinophila]
MPDDSYLDRYLYQIQFTPSRPNYTIDSGHPSGHEIRRQAQVLGDQNAYHTDVWYPGFESYVATETEARANHLPHHAPFPAYKLPDVLVAGKRQTSEDDPQDVLQLAAGAEAKGAMSDSCGSECNPLMEVYELPAYTDYAGTLKVSSSVSESHQPFSSAQDIQHKSKRSSLLPDFGYLRPWVTSTILVSASTQQVEDVDDLIHLSRFIIAGGNPLPVSTPSAAPPEEDSEYLAKLIDVGHAPISPPSASTSLSSPSSEWSAPSLSPTQTSTTSSPAPCSPTTPAGLPKIIARSIVATAPAGSPPLPPKPPEYLALQHRDVMISHAHGSDFCDLSGAREVFTGSTEAFPRPLPPKPKQYRPRACRSPIDYEARVEAKYYRGVSQRLRSLPERSRRVDEEGEVLHVVCQDVPGWVYSGLGGGT